MMDNLELHFSAVVLDSGITVYRLGKFNFATIEAWVTQSVADDQVALAQGLPRATLMDVSQAGYPTPYFIRRMTEATKQTPPELKEVFAVLVANTGVMALVPYLLSFLAAKYQDHTRLFLAHQETEALAWLEERYHSWLDDLKPPH